MDSTQSAAYLPAIANGSPNLPPNSYESSRPQQAPALSGGLPGVMQAIKTIEQGYQMLVETLPSSAQLAAQHITALRTSLPAALQELSGQAGAGPQQMPGPPQPPPGASIEGQG